MAELNDLIINYPFKCQKCEAELTSDWLIAAVVTYGVILLVGEKDAFIGWSCPGCRGLSTNFIRLERDSFNQVVDALRTTLMNTRLGKLCYNSFPYRYDLRVSDFSRRAGRELLAEYETMHEWRLKYDEPQFEPTVKYCSYDFASDSLGPIIYVWWYDGSQVENLMQRENETGLKLFPRFIVHHSMYSSINKFCWDHRIYLEEVKASNRDMSAFFRTPANRTPKAVGFLILLDTVNTIKISSLSLPKLSDVILPSTLSSDFTDNALSYQKLSSREKIFLIGDLWKIFYAEWVQQLLNDLAENYISDYLSEIVKISCSLSSIQALNSSYLKTLFEAFSSRNKQLEIRGKAYSDLRNRVIEAEKSYPNVKIISEDKEINNIKIQISKIASSKLAFSFLILGERGTGKEIFAKAIHEASLQKGRLIKVDCGAITGTLFESEIFGHLKGSFTGADKDRLGAFGEADGGSVFFDEIGNLPLNLQPKLLRALQDQKYVPVGSSTERSIDAKFIFATNRNLDDMVSKDLFMPDLYDRLNSFPITIPPLRERKDDINILVKHFINLFGTHDNKDYGDLPVTKDCLKILKSLDWPGNIRDLEKVIRFVMINRIASQDKSEITELDLPSEIGNKQKNINSIVVLKKKLPGNKKIEDDEIIHLIKEHGHNKTRVAEQLGVTYKTIWLRCKKLGL